MDQINKLKYFLLMIALGIVIGVLNAFLLQSLQGSENSVVANLLRGAIFGGMMVAALVYISRSIKRGGCRWLLKNPSQ